MLPEVFHIVRHVVDVGPLAVAHAVAAVVVAKHEQLLTEEGL